MKYLLAITILAVITALSIGTETIEEKVDKQIEESHLLSDSAILVLEELHDKNDSLLVKYFGE